MSQQPRRKQRNNRRRKANKPAAKQQILSDLTMVKVSSNPKRKRNVITPEYKVSTLHFMSDLLNYTNSGAAYWSKIYKANDLYDPDPSLLTSAVAGFAELARLYFYHLVTKITVTLTASNNEAFPVKIYFGVFNDDPSSSLGNTQAVIDLSENAMCTSVKELAAKGGQDRSTMSLTVNLAELCGDYAYFYGSGYFSTYYNASPATNLIIVIGSYAGSNFTGAGVGLSLSIRYNVKSFNRRPILDSGPIALAHELAKLESKMEELLKKESVTIGEVMELNELYVRSKIESKKVLSLI